MTSFIEASNWKGDVTLDCDCGCRYHARDVWEFDRVRCPECGQVVTIKIEKFGHDISDRIDFTHEPIEGVVGNNPDG